MAQELEGIIKLLREMQRANETNSQSFDKLLASINNRIDVMGENTASTELLKAYLGKITQNLDDKYTATQSRFTEIEKALSAIFKEQDKHAKNKELKELFELFTENLNNFYLESRQQKAILNGIEAKLSNISSDKLNKEEIVRTITLLRKDFENLNHNYKNAIDNINLDLKSILSSMLKLDQAIVSSQVSEQINLIYKATSDIVGYLTSIDKRDAALEKILSNVATNESLKLTNEVINSAIRKSNEICEKLSMLETEARDMNSSNINIQKQLFTEISNKTESIEKITENIKHTLANVTQDIANLPDTDALNSSMQKLFINLNELSSDISNANLNKNFAEIDNKISALTSEMTTIKNIINDINEVIASKIYGIINDISFEKESFDIKSHVSKMLTELPQKQDMDRLVDVFKSNEVSLNELKDKTDNLEKKIDTLKFDTELDNIYNRTTEIKDWIIESNIKDNSEEILSKIDLKSEQKETLIILQTVEKIATELEELSKNMDVKKVNRTVAEVYQIIEELKNDFISTKDSHKNTIIENLSELQKEVSKVVEKNDFENFASDLKTFVEQTVSNTSEASNNFEDIKNYQNIIIDKLNNIDISSFKEYITERISPVEEKLVTISEYLSALGEKNSDDVKEAIAEIKEILENKKSNFNEIEQNNSDIANTVKDYLKEIKVILDTSDKTLNSDVFAKISQLEQLLDSYQSSNENALTEIITKLDTYQNKLLTQEFSDSTKELEASFAEITEIKNRITELAESFKSLNYTKNSKEDNISVFVAKNLEELGMNLEHLAEEFDTKLQHGFAYNAELIEEKTLVLLEFIKELRHANSNNIELYERLTVTDNKLMDFKQELELINTDIVNNVNSKTEEFLQELQPVKEILLRLANLQNNPQNENVKNHLEVLHDTVQDDLVECTKYSKSTFDKLENTYERISKDLSTTENNLRDFILGDIDSVIIKIDNLRTDLEESLTRIAPPEAEHMAEFKTFVNQINVFKSEQFELIEKASQEIKESINENINLKHEELKSMITVSLNNEEIISAIDSLKACLKSKIKEFDISLEDDTEILGTNEFEEAFESNKNAEIINDIKNDFDKFATLISELSDKNPEIDEVLNVIKSKMETISVAKPENDDFPEIIEEDSENNISNNETTEETLVGSGNFDFIKALDLLKQDISNLHKDIEKIISKEEQKQAATTLTAIPTLGSDKLLLSLNNKIELLANSVNQRDWLEEIKTYIAGDQIQSMLEEISGKIDILTLTDNTEWIDEIKQALEQINSNTESTAGTTDPQVQSMLALINEKIDILAATDDYDLLEEVRDTIERIDNNATANNNATIDKLLNVINEKVDILATEDNTEDFEEIKDSLYTIEKKLSSKESSNELENIKSTLISIEEKVNEDTTSLTLDNLDSIKSTLSTIEEKLNEDTTSETLNNFNEVKTALSSIEEKLNIDTTTETLDNLDSIKSTLSTIEEKLNEDTTSETLNSLDDIKYTLLNVDEKVDSVKKLSESDAKITSMLEALNHKIDILAEDGNTNIQEISDVKDLIMAQTDYIESLERNDKTEALRKCLKELTLEVNNLVTSDSTKQIKKTIRDMKESILAAVVTIFEQVSFIEETEDIKDFVEEKTDEINQNLATVTNQLKQITNANEDPDYIYSMQDIESDLAKLRLALNQLQTSEQETQTERLSSILENINNIGSTVEDLQNSLTKEEFFDIKIKFDKVNTDIKSLNALTHQLIAASDKSYAELNNNFEDFGKIITTQLSTKVDKVTKLLETSHASDKVMRQALIYMGEWIDSASESMNKISSNSEEIIDIKSAIEGLKQSVPEQTDILNSIEEKFDEQQERLAYFEKQISKLGGLEDKFEAQQERIDRLEMSLEKILSAVEDIDDSKVTRKIDKIDKQIAKLSTNIEKLTSYVD